VLNKALMLHASYYFTKASQNKLAKGLYHSTPQREQDYAVSRLLNRQLKHEMYKLQRKILPAVLEDLEKDLKTRSKSCWASSFCVVLIVLMCMEEMQICMDGFTMHSKVYQTEDKISSDEYIDTCRQVDHLLYTHLTGLFHGVYKSTNPKSKSKSYVNPIRDGPQLDEDDGLDEDAVDLVEEIREIILENYMELLERARTPSFSNSHDTLPQHMAFRERNSGRLVSKFLLSFDFHK
jgi:hypothetical protein